MILRVRLAELLEKHGWTQREFARRTQISKDRVSRLARNRFDMISREELEVMVSVLNVSIGDLFTLHREDVFLGPRRQGHLTIHMMMRAYEGLRIERRMLPLTLSGWDVLAMDQLRELFSALAIRVSLATHRSVDPPDPLLLRSLRRFCADGSHVVVGSPLGSQFSEHVVALLYGVESFSPENAGRLPYHFRWRSAHRSSFGVSSESEPPGIVHSATKRLVAGRTLPEAGLGEDCGLVITCRIPVAPHPLREQTEDHLPDERVIVVLAGHGGPGTLGCAQLLSDPDRSSDFYPPQPLKPRMRVVSVSYERDALGDGTQDTRRIVNARLLDEEGRIP